MRTGRGYHSSRSSRAFARPSAARLAERVEAEDGVSVRPDLRVIAVETLVDEQVDALALRARDAARLDRAGAGKERGHRLSEHGRELVPLEDHGDAGLLGR